MNLKANMKNQTKKKRKILVHFGNLERTPDFPIIFIFFYQLFPPSLYDLVDAFLYTTTAEVFI